MTEQPIISIIIPSYNAEAKIFRSFDSLDRLKLRIPEIEAIFVDDCSEDSTLNLISKYSSTRPWVTFEQLPVNSGTPSVGRNRGIDRAQGEYVFFFDCDDEILPDGIIAELRHARETGADMVRAPLLRNDGRTIRKMNVIPGWSELNSTSEKAAAMVRNHSTTVCGLYRRDHLLKNNIRWPEGQRLGEDAIFLYQLMKDAVIEYVDEPDFVYHTVLVAGAASSTQQYEERELENHIEVWTRSSEILQSIGVDYFAARAQVALQTAFDSMIKRNRNGFSYEGLERLRQLLLRHEQVVRSYTYGARFRELRDLLLDGNFSEFLEKIKIRLLIAGYDLRFITPYIPALQSQFLVQVDEWEGHEKHDEKKSERLRQWADVIHCEWMLQNLVWYSQRKEGHQRLFVRMHRFELGRPYGNQATRDKIDRVIAIAPGTLEEMQQIFGFEREIVRFLPNALDVHSFAHSENEDKVFNLAMIGSVPLRKGLLRALELLKELRQVDPRYTLTIYGKKWSEYSWVANDPVEREYYEACDKFVRSNALEQSIEYAGWVDTPTSIADMGFVLSMSDHEGSHQAVAEGFAAKNISLIYPWPGAEYLYPSQYVLPDVLSMRDYVLECRNYATFSERAKAGYQVVTERYSIEKFAEGYLQLVSEAI
jgi:glycosyltransferase involved in cell wall biosynthesis